MGEPRVTFLMADDDHDDCLLAEVAMRDVYQDVELRFVHDGIELLDYLRREGQFATSSELALPELLLLDLNMPLMSGLQALEEIKSDPALRRLPVVVFSTSYAEVDIERSYDLGASAFITKPMSLDGFTESFRSLSRFYLDIAALPSQAQG